MVCPRCTRFHTEFAVNCLHCGQPLRTALERVTDNALSKAPLIIGVLSGAPLLLCIATSLILPALANQVLGIGAYFGLISITNAWLAVYRDDHYRVTGMRGVRGIAFSGALLVSLVSELARMQNLQTISLPGLPDLPVPSALASEMLAAGLIVIDPLLVSPLLRWIAEGVQYSDLESAGGHTDADRKGLLSQQSS